MPRWRSWLVLGLGLALACSPDSPTTSSDVLPVDGGLANELTGIPDRLRPALVNAHVYGSFRVDGGGSTPAVITSGPANFPGAPKAGPGTCANGLWYNSKGNPTSGSLSKPHPHCIKPSAAIEVVLEPISVCFTGFLTAQCARMADKTYLTHLVRFDERGTLLTGYLPKLAGSVTPKTAVGEFADDHTILLTGYAIDATTLGITNKRVGTLTLDLAQYHSDTENYLEFTVDPRTEDLVFTCSVDPGNPSPCLNKVISAKYNPLPAPDGLGPTDFTVSGFLWLQSADAPFNYLDDPNYVRDYVCPQEFADRFGVPNPPLGDIFSALDAELYCQSIGAADVTECRDRLLVLAGLVANDPANPCFPAA